jgi:hypothetical protein
MTTQTPTMRLFYHRHVWRLTPAGDQITTTAASNLNCRLDFKIEIVGLRRPLRGAGAKPQTVATCAKQNDSHRPDGRPSRRGLAAFRFEASDATAINLIEKSKTTA